MTPRSSQLRHPFLAGNPPEKLVDDNAYVLFLRCKQAAQTPELRVPLSLVNYVKNEDRNR